MKFCYLFINRVYRLELLFSFKDILVNFIMTTKATVNKQPLTCFSIFCCVAIVLIICFSNRVFQTPQTCCRFFNNLKVTSKSNVKRGLNSIFIPCNSRGYELEQSLLEASKLAPPLLIKA